LNYHASADLRERFLPLLQICHKETFPEFLPFIKSPSQNCDINRGDHQGIFMIHVAGYLFGVKDQSCASLSSNHS
jgi:hypothetical protein